MLLGASSQQSGLEANLNAVTEAHTDPGVPHAAHLRALTEAAIGGDWLGLEAVRKNSEKDMGVQQTVDALVVAAAFNGITRVADATGIPLDANTEYATTEMRSQTGIQNFAYAEKSARYG